MSLSLCRKLDLSYFDVGQPKVALDDGKVEDQTLKEAVSEIFADIDKQQQQSSKEKKETAEETKTGDEETIDDHVPVKEPIINAEYLVPLGENGTGGPIVEKGLLNVRVIFVIGT